MKNKGNYLSIIMEKYNLLETIKLNQINLIVGCCGSGKSYWSMKELCSNISGELEADYLLGFHRVKAYVTDNLMLRDCIYYTYKNKLQKDINDGVDVDVIRGDYGEYILNGARFYTYSGFSEMIKHKENKNQNIDFIEVYFDEIHNLINYHNRFGGSYTYLLNNLNDLAKKTKIIAMTATPERFIWFAKENDIHCVDILGKHKCELQHYDEGELIIFSDDLLNYLDSLNFENNSKYLIYTNKISNINRCVNHFVDKGINAQGIWSKRREKDYPMTSEQHYLINYLIENNKLPDELQVLVINDAYTTGWNLVDDSVNIVIINSSDYETVIQCRNRVRHDIKELHYKLSRSKKEDMFAQLFKEDVFNDIIFKYSNKPLFKEDIVILGKELFKIGVINKKGKPCTTIKAINKTIENYYSDYTWLDDIPYIEIIEKGIWKKSDSNRDKSYTIIN